MSEDEGSTASGLTEPGATSSKATTLRQDLQMQIDRLMGSNDIATTGELAHAFVAVQAILDDFDARLRAVEAKGGALDFSKAENSGNLVALVV